MIVNIPLDNLSKSPLNVRKTGGSDAGFEELKASIVAHGLLENLIAVPAEDNPGHYEVIGGGRRLDALMSLRAEGALPDSFEAPCLVREIAGSAEDLKELSLAENVAREAMHPADQFEVWRDLVEAGASTAAVAARFGVSEKLVEKRLRLGRLAPGLIEAYRADELSLEQLTAFTLTADMDEQLSVLQYVRDQPYSVSAHSIRRQLTERHISAASRLGLFVGEELYEKAGGSVTRDLFSERESSYFEDADLVRRLAREKLEARARELLQEGWKWAEAADVLDYADLSGHGRVFPEPLPGCPEREAELAGLQEKLDSFDTISGGDWTDELEEEACRISERYDELVAEQAANVAFADADKARAGCIVTIGGGGDFRIEEGLVRPDDLETPAPGEAEGGGEEAPAEPGGVRLSQALKEDLTASRLQITRSHLAGDFGLSFDLALYCLCLDVLQRGYAAKPLDLRIGETACASSLDDLDNSPAGARLEGLRGRLSLSWLNDEGGDAFLAMCALTRDEKEKLFAWCIAAGLKGQLASGPGADPVLERTGERLGIAVEEDWRPTAANYWKRIRKADALAMASGVLDASWGEAHAKLKKGDLAARLGAIFSGEGPTGLPKEVEIAARAWLPEGMAYGAGKP